jgi:hypothetical protein
MPKLTKLGPRRPGDSPPRSTSAPGETLTRSPAEGRQHVLKAPARVAQPSPTVLVSWGATQSEAYVRRPTAPQQPGAGQLNISSR